MKIRFCNSPAETKTMDTEQLRANFLVQDLMKENKLTLVYSHYDRVIIGGVKPQGKTITLQNEDELKADFFLQRREMGVINVGGKGTVTVDGSKYQLNKLECLYISRGSKKVNFASSNSKDPAVLYILSAPAHKEYPTTKYTKEQASPVNLGSIETSNKRTIYKYIHDDGIQSCQLVMGLTVLETGSVWNSVPPHTHTRRMEVYFYFDLPQDQRMFHMMGQPQQTRHIIMKNHEAVISPPWSGHYGCGTSNYGFIWGMAGENKQFTDMDATPVSVLL